jgi:hypothetical protein
MKRVLFTIIWMIIFCIIGVLIFGIFACLMYFSSSQLTGTTTIEDYKVRLIIVVDWLFPIGLPILAIVLGIYGLLPGTRIKAEKSDDKLKV